MMCKRGIAVLLAAVMLLSSACQKQAESQSSTSAPDESISSSSAPAAEVQSQEEEDQPIQWGSAQPLSADQMPDQYNGLELPIRGATGYTSVELPLWANTADCAAAKQAVADWKAAQEKLAQERLEKERLAAEKAAQEKAAQEKAAQEKAAQEKAAQEKAAQEKAAQEATAQAAAQAEMSALPDVSAESESSADGGESSVQVAPASSEEAAPQPEEPASEPEPAASAEETPSPSTSQTEEPLPEEAPTLTDGSLTILKPGTPFTVLGEEGEWWHIQVNTDYTAGGVKKQGEVTGWVQHRYCLVNLPDVIPSMIYDATNSYSSRFVSCGKPLDGVTGEALYPTSTYNQRLGEYEYMMPVLYSMAIRLCEAQRNALSEGNSLVLYEGYRPHEVQTLVYNTLSAMTKTDPEIKEAVTGSPWKLSWFISSGYSNHQRGFAVDVSLARVNRVKEYTTGGYRYVRPQSYDLYEMPSAIHELSRAAATYTKPVAVNSPTAWKTAELAPTMNDPALGLQKYCTQADLTPLSSEWWHFNDLGTRSKVLDNLGVGGFVISSVRSTAP